MTRSMVLVVNFNPKNKGSLKDMYLSLAKSATRTGWALHFVFPLEGFLVEELRLLGCECSVIPFRTLGPLRSALSFIRLLRAAKPSVVNTHFYHAVPTLAAMIVSPASQVVWSLWSAFEDRVDLRRTVANTLVRRILAPRISFICGSDFIRRQIAAYGWAEPERVAVCHVGIDPARFDAVPDTAAKSPGSAFRIGMIARFAPPKDHETLIRAVAKLVSEKHTDLELWLFGTGPREGLIRNLSRELGVEDHVVFHGYVDRVEDYLIQLDVAVLTTWFESVGYGVIEPLTLGIPVVATNVGGIPEGLTDGVSGLLVKPGDPDALADALQKLIDNPELRGRMGAAGKREVRQKFDLIRQVQAYLLLIEQSSGGVMDATSAI